MRTRGGRGAASLVVEVRWKPTITASHGRPARVDDDRTRACDRLDDAGSAADQDPFARLRPERRRPCADVSTSPRPGCRSTPAPPRARRAASDRVVGDEQHPVPGRPQRGDRLDRPGDRLVRQPHDAVEIAADTATGARRHDATGVMSGHRGTDACQPVRRAPLRTVPPPCATPPQRRSTTSPRRPTTCSPTADIDALAARHRTQHRAHRRPAASRRSRPLRARRGDSAEWDRDGRAGHATRRRRSRCTGCASPARPAQPAETVGVIGALEVVDEGAGGVLPHERTTPKAKTDRLDLTRATEANLSPVWGLSLAAGLTAPARDAGRARRRRSPTTTASMHTRRAGRPTRRGSPAIAAAVAARPGADRRRPPPLRGQPAPTATSAAPRPGGADGTRRADAGVRRRAGRRPAERRRDPPRCSTASPADRRCARVWPVVRLDAGRAECSRSLRHRDGRRAGALCLVDAGRHGTWLHAPGRARSRECGPGRRAAGACAGRTSPTYGRLPARRRRDARRRHERRGRGRRPDPAGERRPRSAAPPRGPADAAEVDVLHPEAAHRAGGPVPEL